MTKREPILAIAVLAAVFVIGAAAPFIQVEIFQSGFGLRGASTNLFSGNSNLLNRSIDLSSRQPSEAALSNLAANPNLYQATNAQLTIDANNTGGADTNFRSGDGTFKPVQTNWITGLVSDIANILSAIAGKQPAAAALTNIANNPSLYQGTNNNLTTLAGGSGSPLSSGIAASAIDSGTISTNRLPATIVLSDRVQTITLPQTLGAGLTFGGVSVTNWPGLWGGLSEWEFQYLPYIGVNLSGAEAGGNFSAVSGGTRGQQSGSGMIGHPGQIYVLSASGAALNTGGFYSYQASGLFDIANGCVWRYDFQAYVTNGANYRIGICNSVTASDGTDGFWGAITNNTFTLVAISNSVRTITTTSVVVPQRPAWLTCVGVYLPPDTNATIGIYSNGVLLGSSVVSGLPIGRNTYCSWGGVNSLAANTNGAAILQIDSAWMGFRTVGYR